MKIIDGKALAAKLRAELKEQIENFGEPITLAVVMAGENPASQVYVRNKVKACAEVGVRSVSRILPENCTQEDLEATLTELADDESVNGILLQLPLPANLDERSALKKIPVEKDVDGFSEENVGKLAMNRGGIAACTPLGVMKMLESAGTEIRGKRAVVIGRSNTVGRPMAMLLLNADATVTVCHSKTQNVKEICRSGYFNRRDRQEKICNGGHGEGRRDGNRRGYQPRRKRKVVRRRGFRKRLQKSRRDFSRTRRRRSDDDYHAFA